MEGRKCGVVSLDKVYNTCCDLLPSNANRASLVDGLINAYELLDEPEVDTIEIYDEDDLVSPQDLTKFHDKAFVDFLMKPRPAVDTTLDPIAKELLESCSPHGDRASETEYGMEEDDREELESYGLLYDCLPFPHMGLYVRTVATSTLIACQWLIDSLLRNRNKKLIAMNWYGGRHHAKREKALGFCYVNDVVLGITKLRAKFGKVFYLDLDLHHGDGVAKLFKMSNKVLTCSLHRFDFGFYPGTGDLAKDRGSGSGEGFDVNLPLRKGLSSKVLNKIVRDIILPLINDRFQPDCVVIQCGCDGLASDPHKEWNLTIKGYAELVEQILSHTGTIPVLLLGGGGYNHCELAKFWTYLTAMAIRGELADWDEIPEHENSDVFDSFQFWSNSQESYMKDLNDDQQWLEELQMEILSRNI